MFQPMKCFTIDLVGKNSIDKLRYPLYVSNKLDGIRAVIHMGKSGSNSKTELPSKHVAALSKMLPTGLDGEWLYGNPTDENCFSLTQTAVMSIDWPEHLDRNELRFYVFDWVQSGMAFDDRLTRIIDWMAASGPSFGVFVEQRAVKNAEQLKLAYETALNEGYEGIITKSMRGLYKQSTKDNRSTFSEGAAGKLKPYGKELFEAIIIDWYPLEIKRSTYESSNFDLEILEELENGNVIVAAIGGFNVQDYKTKVEFDIGGGKLFTMQNRIDFYKERASLAGRLVQYKCMTYGAKDKPRMPTAFRWRDHIDMSE